ncbi:hypothetical protein P8C59_004744 [Phyllachora maydis]|uniref:MARVEL domain-containing protein n=1 Tax=Phyllachora maydis TaxID=1825666 RepID=A0AAD9MBL1_9PEZI|nr:hypothetical protein P8C59_004744 [Phyllachora maydis]
MDLIQAILRGLQLFWIVILTALIGNVIANNVHAATSAESAINFSMFVIVISWLATLFGLAAAAAEALAIPIVLLAADGFATLFTFIDAIVLAAKLRAVNCSETVGHDGDWIAYGSHNDEKRCREVQASTVFMWFLFATFVAGMFFTFMSFRRTGGSVRTGGPTMSQVRTGV